MRERPLTLRADEVRAALDGRLTCVRRAVQPQPEWGIAECPYTPTEYAYTRCDTNGEGCTCRPVGGFQSALGDRLWCRETYALIWPGEDPPDDVRACTVEYRADTDGTTQPGGYPSREPGAARWLSPATMPRWASRLVLEVVAVRVERGEQWEWVIDVRRVT